MSFVLNPRLEEDCFHICDLRLCRVLLMNESRYPWFILVPMRTALRELMELTEEEAKLYWRESGLVQRFLSEFLQAEKLNVAALGNMVPQLHIHHIARFASDPAWPAPVWGQYTPEPYEESEVEDLGTKFNAFLGENPQ